MMVTDKFLVKFLVCTVFVVPLSSSILYAQNSQTNNTEKESSNRLIRINKSVSDEIDKAADKIDKSISPKTAGAIERNETRIFFVMGGDFADNGDIETNFRFGAQLHLPRFEKYWKLKFANQDERRDRGQSSVVRGQRTRNTNDDIFVGVSFFKNWDRIEVTYKPQIAINDGVGLDHSIEAETEYEFGRFNFKPTLEFFANHEEGTGTSSSVRFALWLKRQVFALEQGNDGRYVFLDYTLAVNHFIGFGYTHDDRLSIATHYFRSFENSVEDYRLSAYGYYISTNYLIYKNILSLEFKPYIVYERIDNFEKTNGVVINFRVNF